jgi:hypothetical protein
MTHFEYLAIAYSLLLSFTAMRLIEGAPYLVQAERRYWVHIIFTFSALMSCLLGFWDFWSFRETSWDFFRFIAVLANPGCLYFIACTLVPRDPSSVNSWRDHMWSVKTRYFAALFGYFLFSAIDVVLLSGLPPSGPLLVGYLAGFVIAIVGARSQSERTLAAIALLYLPLLAIAVALLAQPGAFAAV